MKSTEGNRAYSFMAASFPRWEEFPLHKDRLSAVLVPLFKKGKDVQVLFLERPLFLKDHGGEMCFPGGEREVNDRGPLETALRETEEEIGLSPQFVQPVCIMNPQHTVKSGFTIYPVAGVIRGRSPLSDLRFSRGEVADFALWSLDSIPDNPQTYRVLRDNGKIFETPQYTLPDGRVIWGATAFILRRFIYFIRKGDMYSCL